ncbi:MAG: DUF4282 domain-containing protein [Hyphomonadaceae bacterium]
MPAILQRFLSFERLIGPSLVKLIYYVAAAAIVLMVLGGIMLGLMAIAGGFVGRGLMQIIAAPAVGAVALLYWRFLCELFLIAFMSFERLGEMRDSLRIATGQAAAPDPNHPQF